MLNDTYIEISKKECIEYIRDNCGFERPSYAVACYFPELQGDDIPEEGHWIMIIDPPHTSIKVNKFSIWYAVNDVGKGHDKYPMFAQRYAKIKTPEGDLRLFPWEYNKIDIKEYLKILDGKHLRIEFMAKDVTLEKSLEEKVFYLQTRGIDRLNAYIMILGDFKDPNLCHLEFHEEYIKMFTR